VKKAEREREGFKKKMSWPLRQLKLFDAKYANKVSIVRRLVLRLSAYYNFFVTSRLLSYLIQYAEKNNSVCFMAIFWHNAIRKYLHMESNEHVKFHVKIVKY